jgi:hypothetical protein
MGIGGEREVQAALPPGVTRYPLYRRLGGTQGRSGRELTTDRHARDASLCQLLYPGHTDATYS